MTIADRVKLTGLPLDQVVVIGSGIMDALGLRKSHDIDLVASEVLFTKLKTSDGYRYSIRHAEEVIEKDDQEIWLSWDNNGISHFQQLWDDGVTINDVRFCQPQTVLEWKRRHSRPKDQNDIVLLQKYLDDSR